MMDRKDILNKVMQASAAIRHKHHLLKYDKAAVEMSMNEVFKPIIDPLRTLVNKSSPPPPQPPPTQPPQPPQPPQHPSSSSSKSKQKIKKEKIKKEKNEENTYNMYEFDSDANNDNDYNDDNYYDAHNNIESISGGDDDNDDVDRTQPRASSSRIISSSPTNIHNDTLKKYLNSFNNKNKRKTLDTEYGVRKLQTGLFIGNSNISFTNDFVHVVDKNYQRTPGLIELLFKKIPNINILTTEDIKNYQTIVKQTNADRKHYLADRSVRESKEWKFKNFIAKNKQNTSKKGSGVYNVALNQDFDYVHWDDPNELVDRLRLILASQNAGNNSHTNEINSIIEELQEAKIIY